MKRDDRKQELLPLTAAFKRAGCDAGEEALLTECPWRNFLRDGTSGEALQMMASCLYESAKDAGIVISEFP